MVTAFLDPETERLVLYDAGHPPSLIHSGGAVRRARRSNLPLGLFPDVPFVPETFPFRNGDTLVLYSDAFLETRNPAGEELSIEGLESLVGRHAALPPEDLASRLVEEVHAFGPVTDDLTLVVVRRRPSPRHWMSARTRDAATRPCISSASRFRSSSAPARRRVDS
jgi:serine phosphatase RsbU (regulator of sigma subunit)